MLHIHRAERADALVEALGALLAEPPADPFTAELISVPTRGMERWLTQRMSGRLGATPGRADGVCANFEFPFPRRLVGDAVAKASGIDPGTDPWLPERAVWPLLEVVDECLHEPWLSGVAPYLGKAARRFAGVRHIADLYDRYALHRPGMVRDWAAGRDSDGTDRRLPHDYAWQAELWRCLSARIGQPGPAERLTTACDRLREEPAIADLPERLSLFGLTRVPAGHLQVLRALAAARDVHLFLLHPSPALWERIAERPPRVVRRAGDPTAALPDNRLLASWGHDSREMQLIVTAGGEHAEHHHPVESGETTLLTRIQRDVRENREPDGDAPLDPDDRSVQVHSCHGRSRQVEVMRDAILHLLAEDPTLEPRDVIVMCPDIETFAPLIQATFGAGEIATDDDELETLPADVRPPDLRVRLADRSLRQTNPMLGVVARLLELAEQRLTASEVLDLADREPVRRRFGLDDEDMGRIEEWVGASGIRWGLDAEHREPFKLDALDAGTWRKGLDRVLLGVTMTEGDQRLYGGVLPLEDVDSGAIDLAGRLAEMVDRLQAAVEALSASQTIDAWATAIAQAADALATPAPREQWQRAELQRLLNDVVAEATDGERTHGTELVLPEVRALLAERLQGRPTRANFRTGHLTICTLVPMRSVPHRVVCLLGLDDGVFPRKAPRDGDDLMLSDPHVGDRDARTEDRQLLLDALLAATDRLIVTYTGNDERTNTPRPPAVPVGELLDAVDRTVGSSHGRDQVRVRHPLQPFDPRNFMPGELGPPGPWSFDKVTLEGARALAGERAEPPPFLSGSLPGYDARLVEVEQLVRFVEHPVREFLRARLDVRVRDFHDEVEDALAVELDGLGLWRVGDRMLKACMSGAGIDAAVDAEIARGTLPPGKLAEPVVKRVRPIVEQIIAAADAELGRDREPGSVDVKVALRDGRSLSGTVPDVSGHVVAPINFSRLGANHRLATWVRLLALTAADPERPFEALTIGRAPSGGGPARVSVARIPPLGATPAERRDTAHAQLHVLLDLFDRGMCEPLPIACKSSAAYAQAAATGADPVKAGTAAWESGWKVPGEDRDEEHELVLGEVLSFGELLAESPRADESGDGWDASDETRFGRYARRLWSGLLAHEKVDQR